MTPRPFLRPRALVWVAVVLGMVALLAYGFASQGEAEGRPAPEFSVMLFDGSEESLSATRGAVVVVNSWASWCGPCREEASALESVWKEYRDSGVEFIGINIKDSRPNALAFLEEFGISYPNGPDPYARISRAYRVCGLPETFVISRNGLIAARFIGAVTIEQLRAGLDSALAS